MLLPRYRLPRLMAITAFFCVASFVASFAVAGHVWAMSILTALLSFIVMFLVFAAMFLPFMGLAPCDPQPPPIPKSPSAKPIEFEPVEVVPVEVVVVDAETVEAITKETS
jgi:hypothetical protein